MIIFGDSAELFASYLTSSAQFAMLHSAPF